MTYFYKGGKSLKNLIIIIGTILLGAVIVNTLILGDGNSLKNAAEDIVQKGTGSLSDYLDFGKLSGEGL